MGRWRATAYGLILLISLVISGCGQGSADSDVIKIGVSAPLTGSIASLGQATRNVALMVEDEVNLGGGILVGDKKFRIKMVIEDDQNDPASTANVFQKLINQDKVVAIIGSQSSSATNAGVPIANDAKVPTISPWATNPEVTRNKPYIFRACFVDDFQGAVDAKFAWETLQARTVAVIYDVAQDASKFQAEAFRDAYLALGGKITAFETYTTGDRDFSAVLTKIKATNPDVLFLPNYFNDVPLQVQQARGLGLNMQILGTDAWDNPDLLALGGAALNGAYFSNHYSADAELPVVQEFVRKYQEKFGRKPDAAGALTYDAAHIIVNAIAAAGSFEREKIRDAIAATRDHAGVTGVISYNGGTGDPVKSAVILKIEDGQFVYVGTVNP